MVNPPTPRTLVVNFNSPELNQLALALVTVDALAAYGSDDDSGPASGADGGGRVGTASEDSYFVGSGSDR